MLGQMFPVDAGTHHETLRRHTLKVGEALGECAVTQPETAASAIVVTLDSTFICSCAEGERHLEVRVGNVETASGGRQVFGAIAKADTDIRAVICRSLDAVGRTGDTALTAFTDGCPGIRGSLADAASMSRRYSYSATALSVSLRRGPRMLVRFINGLIRVPFWRSACWWHRIGWQYAQGRR